jgi:hypothetical protein
VKPDDTASLAEGIWQLFQDRRRRLALGRHAAGEVRARYSVKHSAEQLEAVLREVTGVPADTGAPAATGGAGATSAAATDAAAPTDSPAATDAAAATDGAGPSEAVTVETERARAAR